MNCSFFFFVALMRKMIKPIGQGSFMIDPNCTANDIQPSFSQNAPSFIKARSHDDRLVFYFGLFFLATIKLSHHQSALWLSSGVATLANRNRASAIVSEVIVLFVFSYLIPAFQPNRLNGAAARDSRFCAQAA